MIISIKNRYIVIAFTLIILTWNASATAQSRKVSGNLGIFKGRIDSLLPKQVGNYSIEKTTYGPKMGAEAVARASYTSGRKEYLELSLVNFLEKSGPKEDLSTLRSRIAKREDCSIKKSGSKIIARRKVGERYIIECTEDGALFIYWSNGSVLVSLQSGRPKTGTGLLRSELSRLLAFESNLAY